MIPHYNSKSLGMQVKFKEPRQSDCQGVGTAIHRLASIDCLTYAGRLQDCESMRQAISEVFEAGFQGLEAMIQSFGPAYPPSNAAVMAGIGASRGVPGVRGPALGDLQHGMANLHLKHSNSMPVHLYNPMTSQEYPGASR